MRRARFSNKVFFLVTSLSQLRVDSLSPEVMRRSCKSGWVKSKSCPEDLIWRTDLNITIPCPQVMSQAEGQQKNLVNSIDSLPPRGPLSCLDQDLLLLKATSAATLSCLGECLNILQQTQSHSQAPPQPSERHPAVQRAPSGESASGPIPVLLLEPPTPTPVPLSMQPPPPEPSTNSLSVTPV